MNQVCSYPKKRLSFLLCVVLRALAPLRERFRRRGNNMRHELEHLALTRRELLQRCGMGFGALALGSMLAPSSSGVEIANPLLPKAPHFPAKAKHVIHLFMNGGPSHVDSFD